MADLKPVDYDPFAGVRVTPVEGDPFAEDAETEGTPKTKPIEGDPFNPESTHNVLLGFAARAVNLGAGGARAIGAIAEDAGDWLETHIPISQALGLMTAEDLKKENTPLPKWSREMAQTAKGVNYEPTVPWETLKAEPTVGNILTFIAEQGITSIPDMAAALVNPLAYGTALSGDIAQTRAENKGLQEATSREILEAGPAAAVSALLERFGAQGIIANLGQSTAWRRILAATGRESGTEFAQEQVQYAGETVGTEKPWSAAESLERGAAGALAGAGIGGVGRTGVEIVGPSLGVGQRPTPPPPSAPPAGDAAAAGTPSPEGGEPSPPAAAVTKPSGEQAPASKLDTGAIVGVKMGPDAAPVRAEIEGVQDGWVYWRDEDGNQRTDREAQFRRDLTAPPPPRRTPTPAIPAGALPETPPPDETDINEFDPWADARPPKAGDMAVTIPGGQFAIDTPSRVTAITRERGRLLATLEGREGKVPLDQLRRAPAPTPPSPQGAMPLPRTEEIAKLRNAASAWIKAAAEAQRLLESGSPQAKTPQDIAMMRVEASKLLDQATALERAVTPARASSDPTAATPEQMAAKRLGPLGGAAPAQSEAVTGPQTFQVTQQAAAPPAQGALAPVEGSEAERGPQTFQVAPQVPIAPKAAPKRRQPKVAPPEAPLLSERAPRPAVAPAAAPPQAQAAAAIRRRDIEADTALTPKGRELRVTYAVVEADDLTASNLDDGRPNPAYPQELQPRDRERASSQQQIQAIATAPEGRLLDKTPRAGQGAPIVSPEGIVEDGNGRTIGLKRAYDQGTAQAYRDYLAAQGYPVAGMKKPILVRVRDQAMTLPEIEAFTREANERDTLTLSATEQAMADAKAMSDATLGQYRGGDVDEAGNRDFVRSFIREVVGQNEQAGMVAADGTISQAAIKRIQGALLGKAYGDADLVADMVESADSDIKAIGGALMDVAPQWAQMRTAAGKSEIDPSMDQTERLLEAVKLVQRARREGRAVAELVNQRDIFSGETVHPVTEAFLRQFYRNVAQWTQPAGRQKVLDSLQFYVTEAGKTSTGADLLGDTAPAPEQILDIAKRRQYGNESKQPGLLEERVRDLREDRGAAGEERGGIPQGAAIEGRGEAAGIGGERATLPESLSAPDNPSAVGSSLYGNKTAQWRDLLRRLSPLARNQKISRFMQTLANDSGVEHGVFIDREGFVIWAGSVGLPSGIPFSESVQREIEDGSTPIDLHHNHPSHGGPLSSQDLTVLGYPNAGWVIAYDKGGRFSAARLSDRFRSATERLTPLQRGKLVQWAVSNAHAASIKLHRPLFDAKKLTEHHFEVGDAAWRALHEVGVIDYVSDFEVFDYNYPHIDTIRDQIAGRLKEHGINVAATDRIHRPAKSTGVAAGLAEISGGPGTTQAADTVRPATTERGAQGSLFEGEGPGLRAPERAIPGAPRAETGGVLARILADESGALTAPDWSKIKAFFSRQKTAQGGPWGKTPQQIAQQAPKLGTPNRLRAMGKLAQWLRSGISLAAIDQPSSVYWNANLDQENTKNTLERDAIETARSYFRLDAKAKARVHKILEYARLYGVEIAPTGRDVVVRIPTNRPPFGEGRPELSRPGEVVALDGTETEAFFALRKMFDQTLRNLGAAMAAERGYTGAFDRKSIEEAIQTAERPTLKRRAEAALDALETVEEMRRAGYVPFQRYGDAWIKIEPRVPASGTPEIARFELVDTRSIVDNLLSRKGGRSTKALTERIEELRKRYPEKDFRITYGEVTPNLFQQINLPALEKALIALDANNVTGKQQLVDNLMHELFEKRKAGFRQRARNVPGYSQDFERAISDYVRQTSAVSARMAHRADVDSAYDGTQQHPVKEVRDYWKNFKDHQESATDDFGMLRKVGFFMFLWGTPASAAVNLTQTPLVTMTQLGTWAGPRAAPLANGAMVEALRKVRIGQEGSSLMSREGMRNVKRHSRGLVVDIGQIGKTDAEKAMLAQLDQEGVLNPQIMEDFGAGTLSQGANAKLRPALKHLDRAYDIGASMFNATEVVNRVAAALAYFRAAQNPQLRQRMAEVYKNDQNFREIVAREGLTPLSIARFGVNETQFIGGKMGRAPAMRGFRALLFQFKNFVVNYLRLMHKNFRSMGPQGKLAGSFMLMSLFLIGGLAGIPFGEDAIKAYDFLYERATGIDPDIEWQIREAVKSAGFGEYGAEIATRGFAQNAFGLDMTRLGMGNLFPDNSVSSLMPIVTGTVGRISETTDRWQTGQPVGAAAAILGAIGGKGLQDVVKGTMVYPMEGISTKRGNWTVRPEDVTLADMTMRALGFQPTKATRASQAEYHAGRIANATQERRTKELTRIARLIVNGMEATEAGDREAANAYYRQVEELYQDNIARLLDPSIPDWQKAKPASRQAIRQRVMSLVAPEIARIRRAGKMARPSLVESPFVQP